LALTDLSIAVLLDEAARRALPQAGLALQVTTADGEALAPHPLQLRIAGDARTAPLAGADLAVERGPETLRLTIPQTAINNLPAALLAERQPDQRRRIRPDALRDLLIFASFRMLVPRR
jgi:hypothetical protein